MIVCANFEYDLQWIHQAFVSHQYMCFFSLISIRPICSPVVAHDIHPAHRRLELEFRK